MLPLLLEKIRTLQAEFIERFNAFNDSVSPVRRRQLSRMGRWDYEHSREWKKRRFIRVAGAKGICEYCSIPFDKSGFAIHVHHLTYERYGNEEYLDLLVVDSACHILLGKMFPNLRRKSVPGDGCIIVSEE